MQLVLVLTVVSPPLLRELIWPLLAALAICAAIALLLTASSRPVPADRPQIPRRAFRLHEALLVGGTIATVLLATAAAARWLGVHYAVATVAFGGFADVHSATASAGVLFNTQAFPAERAALAVLLATSANAATKLALAWRGGGAGFALRLAPGLLLSIAGGAITWLLINRAW